MTPILNPFEAARAEMGAWLGYSRKANEAVEPVLAHLVKIRASILNGCANCINMHTREARETWRDRATPLSSRRLARSTGVQRARAGGARPGPTR